MGKNKGKGGKGHKKHKNKDSTEIQRPLIIREDGQAYGTVIRALGNGRFEIKCYTDNVTTNNITCCIRGKMRKREWISSGDLVLVSLRDFQKDKADIIMKYLPYEVKKLKEYKEISNNIQTTSFTGNCEEEEDNCIKFDFYSSSDDEDNLTSNSSSQPSSKQHISLFEEHSDTDSDLDIDNI